MRWRRILPEPGLERVLATATLVQTVGRGVWLTVGVLYLTQFVGLPVAQVAAVLTIASLVTVTTGTWLGYLADRIGPRGMLIGGITVSGLSIAAVVLVTSFVQYLIVAAVVGAVADSVFRGARGAILGSALAPDKRVRTRAYLRAVTNLGIAVGGGLGGLGLAIGTRSAYVTLLVADGAAYLVAAIVVTRLPRIAPVPRQPGPRLTSLRDRPFLAYVTLDGVLSMHYELLTLILPLWIIRYTSAPVWLGAVLLALNSIVVVVLQVRLSQGTETVAGGGRAARRAGFLLALACAFYGAAGFGPPPVAITLLLAGAVVHVLGELLQAASGWSISFGLTPDGSHGQYQGTYAMGVAAGRGAAPLVLTGLILGLGAPGWAGLAVIFGLAGLAVPPVVAWARRNRPPGVPAPDDMVTSGSGGAPSVAG